MKKTNEEKIRAKWKRRWWEEVVASGKAPACYDE